MLHDLEPPQDSSVEGSVEGEAGARGASSGTKHARLKSKGGPSEVYCGEVMALSAHVEDKYGNPWRR